MVKDGKAFRDWARCEAGVAAVEFALIAPILIAAVLTMSDLGFAIHERSEIDQALRNGAQHAISDPGESKVAAVLNLVDPTGAGRDSTTFVVDRFCACSETPDTQTQCSTTCAGDTPTSIFYNLTGTREFSGFLLPAVTLNRSSLVQVR